MSPTLRVRLASSLAAVIIVPALVAAVLQAQAATTQTPVQRMHAHLAALDEIEYAVVRGDLEDVKQKSKELMAQLSMDGLPTDGQKQLGDLKGAAREAGEATSLEAASKAVARMTATCGTCHADLKTNVTLTAPVKPPTVAAVRGRMLEHYYSVEMMSMGLEAPSEELWKRGAQALRDAQVMKITLKDEKLTADLNAAEANFRDLGAKAAAAKPVEARADLYGQVLTSCGQCHSLHGRVFGPGLPKMQQ